MARATSGNKLALKHGAYSPTAMAPRTEEILAELEAGAPLQLPVDRLGLRMTAAAVARFLEMNEWLEGLDHRGKRRGAIDARGRPRGVMKIYYTAYREAHRGLAAHGATAMARAMVAPGMAAMRRNAESDAAQKRLRAKHVGDR